MEAGRNGQTYGCWESFGGEPDDSSRCGRDMCLCIGGVGVVSYNFGKNEKHNCKTKIQLVQKQIFYQGFLGEIVSIKILIAS